MKHIFLSLLLICLFYFGIYGMAWAIYQLYHVFFLFASAYPTLNLIVILCLFLIAIKILQFELKEYMVQCKKEFLNLYSSRKRKMINNYQK